MLAHLRILFFKRLGNSINDGFNDGTLLPKMESLGAQKSLMDVHFFKVLCVILA